MPTENKSDPDLRALRVFEAVLAEGSLSRAAARMDLGQPSVSKVLAQLRLWAGDPLFIRAGSRMEPTARALELAAPVRALLEASSALQAPRAAFDPLTSERGFSFFISDVGIIRYLPPLVERLRRDAPRVRLRAVQLDAQRLHTRLEAGEVDLLIGPFPDLPQSVRRQRLFDEGYVSVVRAGHPRMKRAPSLEAYLREQHVLVSAAGTGHAHAAAERALESVLPDANIAVRLPGFVSAAMVARSSDLVATLPERVARLLAGEFGLRIVRPPLALPRMEICQYWHERFHRDPGHRWLRGLFHAMFGEKPGDLPGAAGTGNAKARGR